jgi:hypothetical protein
MVLGQPSTHQHVSAVLLFSLVGEAIESLILTRETAENLKGDVVSLLKPWRRLRISFATLGEDMFLCCITRVKCHLCVEDLEEDICQCKSPEGDVVSMLATWA